MCAIGTSRGAFTIVFIIFEFCYLNSFCIFFFFFVYFSYKKDPSSAGAGEAISQAVDAVESLFLLITVGQCQKYLREMKICLECAVSLCSVKRDLSDNFVQLIGVRLMSGAGKKLWYSHLMPLA